MNIPVEVLEVLKCSSCELYLSRGPVYLLHDGAAACGRCYTLKHPAARNNQYEAITKLLKFPCKNQEFGCLVTVPYVGQDEVIEHEEVCEHRQYVCPMLGSARCDWLGPRAAILAHCHDQHPDSALEKCAGCAVEVTIFLYRGKNGWRCEHCAPAKRICENQHQGCTHTDIGNKCSKHEYLFCQQRTQCFICSASVSRGTLSAHYISVHQNLTDRAGSTWRMTRRGWPYCLVSSVAGTAVCGYWLDDLRFRLVVFIPVSGHRLSEFRCEMRLTNPATGHARTFTAEVNYDELCDWLIVVHKEEFPWLNTELDVCVEIRKAES